MIVLFFFLLPVVALAALLILGKTFWHNRRARWMVWGSAAGSLGIGAAYLWAIFHSSSSTAAIGILFVPMAMAMAAPVGALLGAMSHEAAYRRARITGIVSIAGLAACLIPAAAVARHILQFHHMQSESDGSALSEAARTQLRERDYFLLAAIAANPRTPEAALLEIAVYPDPGLHEKRTGWINSYDKDQLAVVRKVIRHPRVPVEALVKLSASKNEYVLGDLAQQQRTPAEILQRLAGAPHGYLVDWGLALNPSTPAPILEALAYRKDKTIAQLLARNTSTPIAILEELAVHGDAMVRGSVAANRSAPSPVLRRLSTDSEAWVARQAEWQLRQPR